MGALRKYEVIAEALKQWIQEQMQQQDRRQWADKGIRLPAVRVVAEQYQCSVSTAIRAYEWLEQRHLVYAIPQSGYYAVQNGTGAQDMDWQGALDFASAAPDPRVFPYADFRHCVDQAMEKKQAELFMYGTDQGLPSLILLLQKQFADYQVFARTEQFFITSGVQQALAVLALMPFPNGKRKVLLELPTYHNMPSLLSGLNVPIAGVRRALDGLDWASLERQFAEGDIKFFYVMPRFHNPIGTSLTVADKKRLIRLAQRYDVYLVEDDYLADLEDNTKQDPLWSYDTEGRVIYLKSYSKILFPGLRIGVAVLPSPLIQSFGAYKKMLDIDTSVLSQAALEIYVHSGMFAHHRKVIRNRYAARMNTVHEQLDTYPDFAPFMYAPRTGGEHTVLPLAGDMPLRVLLSRLQKRGVIVDTTERYYPEGTYQVHQDQMLRLNISNVPKQRIEEGMQKIREEILKLQIRQR
ncbi:GntR family transcriptional regulator [Paenibacillus amylolyticus]|uniref:aminotransferase-like domain-containing protein n=1 Tax=Paenibacillus amylolyticus TaxID=1451 RepID=UPI00096E9508|nr:PLP-dependent aminotransferase family protein [Paenibacillus amylolyticus]OME99089.1 GntR family transcriptional regulator [Paenibacillus amylolyticus]WFA83489.1 PLP-dependent aminotransferase family protein [Paenibacillus amylolyticus]